MSKMFTETSALAEQMRIELEKQECKLEDGSMVSNLQGIAQGLIGRALNGDMNAIQFITELTGGKIGRASCRERV